MSEAILELKNVEKSFGTHQVHKGVNIELRPGETIGLLGNSGTGKSVLLRSIIGLEYIDQGEITYHGKRLDTLSEIDLFKVRTKISYAFQNGALFDSVNVFENIAYPLFEHTDLELNQIKQKVADLLKLIGLEGKEHVMPSDLSGGMQKRVGLARAIVLEPEIILYDEPTAGLDPLNTVNILSIMEKFKEKKMSGIFVTHDIPAAMRVCDRILILDNGKIYFNGTPKELESSKDPVIEKFFALNKMEKHDN